MWHFIVSFFRHRFAHHWTDFFQKMGQSRPLFCLFLSSSLYNFSNTNWKKHRWCAWDANPQPQDRRHRWNLWAMAAALNGVSPKLQTAINKEEDNSNHFLFELKSKNCAFWIAKNCWFRVFNGIAKRFAEIKIGVGSWGKSLKDVKIFAKASTYFLSIFPITIQWMQSVARLPILLTLSN